MNDPAKNREFPHSAPSARLGDEKVRMKHGDFPGFMRTLPFFLFLIPRGYVYAAAAEAGSRL